MPHPRNHVPPALPEFAAAFIEQAGRRSAATYKDYRSSLRKFQTFAQGKGFAKKDEALSPTALPDTALTDFFLWLDKHDFSNSAIRLYLVVVQRFLEWLEGQQRLPDGTTDKMKKLLRKTTGRTNERLRPERRGSDPEIGRLMFYYQRQMAELTRQDKLTDARRLICLRNQALLLTLYATAGRAAEVRQITRAQVEGAEQVEVKGKRRKKRVLYLTDEAQRTIAAYLRARGQDGNNYVFVSHRRKTRKAMTTASLWDVVNEAALAVFGADAEGRPRKRFGPHAFRHQRAQDLVDHGMPIEDVQALLDHENILVTRSTYAPKTPRQKLERQLKRFGRSVRKVADRTDDSSRKSGNARPQERR